jgi:hypothetical protein
MNNKKLPKINFEFCLSRGHGTYNRKVGDWWHGQAQNGAHKRAYKNITKYFQTSLNHNSSKPLFIIDYACGNGALLIEMAEKLPKARFIGLDGSNLMLRLAMQNLQKRGIEAELCPSSRCFDKGKARIRLVKTVLPNFTLPRGKADAAAFIFPNLTCAMKERPRYERNGYNNRKDTKVAEMLARFRETDPEEETAKIDPLEFYDDLMTAKVISRNLRQLLKKHGALLRVDYANAPREQLSELTQRRSLFTEGALDIPIKGCRAEQDFRYLDSRYHRSSVIMDVFHQTGDPTDREGGYFCSMFTAV